MINEPQRKRRKTRGKRQMNLDKGLYGEKMEENANFAVAGEKNNE